MRLSRPTFTIWPLPSIGPYSPARVLTSTVSTPSPLPIFWMVNTGLRRGMVRVSESSSPTTSVALSSICVVGTPPVTKLGSPLFSSTMLNGLSGFAGYAWMAASGFFAAGMYKFAVTV